MAEIKIYGTLVNATTDPKIAKASQIFDEELNKYQSEINTQLGISDDSLHKELTNFKNTKGKANGLASLDDSGKVPSTQLPSYVDDVLEFTQLDQLPKPGESGKIYVVTSTNLQYRWSGSDYVEISKSLALGETSSTAYPGDKGKATTDVVNSLSDNLVNDVLVSQSDKNSVSLTIKSITKNPVKKNKELLLVDGEPILLTDNTPILLADNVNDGLYDQADDKLITINQASSFTAGVMSASDKTKLDGLKAQAEIDTSISNVQNNLNAHINNRTNPHRVTKEQIGLDQVDNTSDANKPISNATQTALNGKFSATDGNALKQTIEDMPNLVVTEGSVSHKNNKISLSLRQQDLKDPVNTDSILLTFNPATDSTAGVMSASDKTKLDGLKAQAEIDTSISNVQNNLNAHINNRTNPHRVTKEQIGLDQVDNTSDANKPISNATQTALNGKFSATDGNALKQTIEDMPNLVVTEGSVSHKNNKISLSLRQQDLKDPVNTDSILLTFNPATDSTAGIILPSDKSKIDKIITNGNGTKYLSDNGTYKEVQGGSADIESLKQYVNDNSISSARSVGYMMQLTEIDASGLDENTWYPVTIAAGARMCMRAEVLVALDSGTKPSWSTHERGFSTRKIWEFASSTWGVNAVSDIKVYLSDFAHTNLDPVRGLDFLSHFDTCFVFVRGGGKYHFYTSHGAQVILHTSTYKPSEASEQSVSPTTTTPKPINALDLKNYGKVIDVLNGSYLTLNVNRVGADAIDYINNVFGSKGRLKEVIMDIIENHQRYLFHSYASGLNCVEPNNVYAYYDYAKNEYNLQYNLSYYTTNGPVSKRASFLVTPYDEGYKVEVTDLATNWATLDGVLSNVNEFNFVDGEFGDRVWLNYRSRSGNTITANKIYIGNGQANGGFAEVYASGFFKESDIRLKSNIVPLNHTLDQICNIPTVEFDMHDKHQIGTVAQDLENNFAEIVNTDSDGMKSVDYCMLGVVAVEGIKLLKQEIEDLKKQVEELKNGNAILGRNL